MSPSGPTSSTNADLEIARAVTEELLARREPLTFDELLDIIDARADLDLGREPEAVLDVVVDGLWSIVELPGDRLAHVHAILDGAALSHRLTADEIAHGYVPLDPDLHLVERLMPDDSDEDEDEDDVGGADEDRVDDLVLPLAGGASLALVAAGPDNDRLRDHGLPEALIDELAASDRVWVLLVNGFDLSAATPGDAVVLTVDAANVAAPVALHLTTDRPGLISLALDDDLLDRFDEALAAAFTAASAIDELDGLQGYEAPAADEPPAPTPLDEVLLQMVLDRPELFGPGAPPLGEVLEALPWEVHGDFIAPAGTDWASWNRTMDVIHAGSRFNLDPDQTVALGLLLSSYDDVTRCFADPALDPEHATRRGAVSPGTESYEQHLNRLRPDALVPLLREAVEVVAPPDRLRQLAQFLALPGVGEAFSTEVLRLDLEPAPDVEAFAHLLRDATAPKGAPRAAACWLLARALNRQGFALPAAAALDEAMAADASIEAVLIDAAHLASDRGDAPTALRFAERAQLAPDDPWVSMLRAMVPPERNDLGRNDPCHCGSGRKYKQCHLGREGLPIERRADWIWHKAKDFMQDGPWRNELIEVTMAFLSRDELDMDVMLFAMREAVVSDLVLFESGAWTDFLSQRGALLPEDEQVVAQEWQRIHRSVFEVVDVERGVSVTVRDLRTGATTEVPSKQASFDLARGLLVLAHVVPVGASHAFVGGLVPVNLAMRDPLIDLLDTEPDGVALAAFLGRFLSAPAHVTNSEGEDLLLCEITYRLTDPVATAAALDAHEALRRADDPDHGDPADDGDRADATWLEEIEQGGRTWIRGKLALRGDELTVETNSEARADRLAALLDEIAADRQVLHDQRVPADEMIKNARRGSGRSTAPLDSSDPDTAAMIDEYIREREIGWLDEQIPLLDGLTPREAAADPTHRDDLIRLLTEFDDGSPAESPRTGGFNAAALRAHLGLEDD